MGGEVNFADQDLLVNSKGVVVEKWRIPAHTLAENHKAHLPSKHLKNQYPQRPPIGSFPVSLALDDFGC